MKKNKQKSTEQIELERVRDLLILQLIRDGAKAEEIARAIGVTKSWVTNKFSMRKLKKK